MSTQANTERRPNFSKLVFFARQKKKKKIVGFTKLRWEKENTAAFWPQRRCLCPTTRPGVLDWPWPRENTEPRSSSHQLRVLGLTLQRPSLQGEDRPPLDWPWELESARRAAPSPVWHPILPRGRDGQVRARWSRDACSEAAARRQAS